MARETASGLYLGLMSGTSADGIDAALVRIDAVGRIRKTLYTGHRPYADGWASRVRSVGPRTPLSEVADLDAGLGDAFAAAAGTALAHAPDPVRAIGCHGQTVWHAPSRVPPATIQLGDPNRIAAATGVTTVADFRRRDLVEGGEGAPLAPAFHAACFGDAAETRVVLNLGGIANLSVLHPEAPPGGFDTGPANTLLDQWARENGRGPVDDGGEWAATGRVDETLLTRLMSHPYITAAPPKSTGPEAFHIEWVRPMISPGTAAEDVQATLAEFSARSVATGLSLAGRPSAERVLVCGGGVHNTDLMARLGRLLAPMPVSSTAEVGVDPDYVEAIGFAWLAWARIHEHPSGCRAATGAARNAALGGVYSGKAWPVDGTG